MCYYPHSCTPISFFYIFYNMKILSTKCLTSAQQQRLQALGFTLLQHNFIATPPLPFALSLPYSWLIFTSQNGVQSVLDHPQWQELLSTPVLCVGVKTQQLLQSKGFKVCYAADYATDLVAYMRNDLSRYQEGRIAFFVSTHRLNTLPDFFASEKLQVAEITVYDTVFTPITLAEPVDAILFFSPSGVQSYLSTHTAAAEQVFCIGTTTAQAATPHWASVIVATEPTVDGVLQTVAASLTP